MASNTQSIRLNAACRGSRKIASTWPARRCREYLAAKGDVAVGDAVYGLIDFFRDGGAAEYVAVRPADLAPKPRSLDHPSAAATPLSALTAWQALFDHARLTPGQRVLIHGAAGGVGSFAVQLARWRGAHVVGTASARNGDFVRDCYPTQVEAIQRAAAQPAG
jgi:NADPH:quinone reductase-like Zn-dependent oxidoreductase